MPVTHDVYGDESVFNNAVVYGLVVVPVVAVPQAEEAISSYKEAKGLPREVEIHCREIFHPSARARSVWSNLKDDEIIELFTQISVSIRQLEAFCRIGFIDKRQWPKILPKEGEFPATRLDDKQLAGFAFQAAVAPLEGSVGIPNVRLWIDYDHTKIPWFGKKRQAYRSYRSFSGISKQWLEPQPKPESKPILLQAADIVAYISAHALCVQHYRKKAMFLHLYDVYDPERSVLEPHA